MTLLPLLLVKLLTHLAVSALPFTPMVQTGPIVERVSNPTPQGFNNMASLSRARAIIKPNDIHYIDAQYAADFSKDAVLVGASHNIFVVKILKKVSTSEFQEIPETQFTAEVIENIKGSVQGVITLDQVGGYKDNALYLPDGSGSDLLHPGSTYVVATRYYKEKDWYTVNSYPTAIKLLSKDSQIDSQTLLKIVDQDARVKELKAAYPHEILLDADVRQGKTLNNYQSTHTTYGQDTVTPESQSGLQDIPIGDASTSTESKL